MSLRSGSCIVLRSLLISYLLTGILLLFTALLLYLWEPEKSLVYVGILVIYTLCCFLGGLLAGRSGKNRRFLWGAAVGALYYALLLLASCTLGGGIQSGTAELLSVLALCLGGGTLGGMLS